MQGTSNFFGFGWGRGGFCFYFLFPCIPCPFTCPPTGTRGTHPGTDYKGAECGSPPSADIGHGSRVSLWAAQEQESMSYNLPWRKGQQSGKALNRSQERRGEEEKVQTLAPRRGRAGNLLPGVQTRSGEEKMATGHIVSICGRDRWPQVSKVSLGPTRRSSGEGLRG